MISRERLEELIEQEATVYDIGNCGVCEHKLKREMKLIHFADCEDFDYFECSCEKCIETFGHPYDIYTLDFLLNCYETKAEAEWVAKMHAERVEKFEPPFELNNAETYHFIGKDGSKCYIAYDKGVQEQDLYIVGVYTISWDTNIKHIEENYTKAVEYARKLFLGEEK